MSDQNPSVEPVAPIAETAPVSVRRQRLDAAKAETTPGRRSRASTGGLALKLDAPQRPGFVRRFVNGDPSRIRRLQELGYVVVQDQAASGTSRTEGLGKTIARHAGKTEDGAPMQAYLMETPQEEYDLGMQDREDARKPFEEAIRRSADTTGQVEGAYQPGKSTIQHSG